LAVDLVLSSGFLAFAEQAGFLAAVEDSGLTVEGVCGTSSGALAGSLWCAGVPAHDVFELLCGRAPVRWLARSPAPWRGLFGLGRVAAELRERLPARFDGLSRAFGAGVVHGQRAQLLTEGPLPEAVAASCAVPWLFHPVRVDGRELVDGGARDRLALSAWRAHRPGRELVVHLVDSSRGHRDAGHDSLEGLTVCTSARSGARLWSLGDARARFEHSRARAMHTLRGG
jgi:predicted acylesterase/phospholipase RssA